LVSLAGEFQGEGDGKRKNTKRTAQQPAWLVVRDQLIREEGMLERKNREG